MIQPLIWIPRKTPALFWAEEYLRAGSCRVSSDPQTCSSVLLPIPTQDVPAQIPPGIPVFGGFLSAEAFPENPIYDLLKDEDYLCGAAALTADCAVRLAGQRLPRMWKNCPVLVIGHGRIGKFLLSRLHRLECHVTIGLRNRKELAFLRSQGRHAIPISEIPGSLSAFRVIFNTVPAPVLSREETALCPAGTILMDLASVPGMAGDAVVSARGLPGKLVPESAGELIGRTVVRLLKQEEILS